MIDPQMLIAGSQVVYGEERFRQLYGDIEPIPEPRVQVVHDGERFSLGGRHLELIHTPGHALHHYAIVDRAHASIFPGDTFGISYRELDTAKGAFIIPTTTPSQFDPDQLIASIDRMAAYAPESMYLMHFSRVTQVPRLAASLKAQIREIVRITRHHAGAADRHAAIRGGMRDLWLDLLHRHGCALSDSEIETFLKGDLDLNTLGLIVWLDRQK
jgi:glyoxylase-like metal-dependent hydrolase (beta-lactamase superfamily II)